MGQNAGSTCSRPRGVAQERAAQVVHQALPLHLAALPLAVLGRGHHHPGRGPQQLQPHKEGLVTGVGYHKEAGQGLAVYNYFAGGIGRVQRKSLSRGYTSFDQGSPIGLFLAQYLRAIFFPFQLADVFAIKGVNGNLVIW